MSLSRFRYVFGDYNDEKAGDCKLYGSGTFSDGKCGNTLHDWAYLTDPPVVEVEENVRAACSTECPDADGQIYTAKNKQVKLFPILHGTVLGNH